jgi:nitrite reductase/ring-hydroxylating ferredoxin subunit
VSLPNTRRLRRFVEDLLRHRRPRPFRAGPGDDAELRAAILLRSAGPDSGPADAGFVDDLHRRLAESLGNAPAPAEHSGGRRRFVQVTSVAAASAALGVTLDRVLTSDPKPADTSASGQAQTIVPDSGEWRAVVASKDLPEGGVRPFDLGAVNGFVERAGGTLRAVSGTCTHLGCKLALDAPARQLNCPCHNAAFAVDGTVLHHRLPFALPPLPHLLVRESDGVIQVFVPSATA